MRNYSKPWFDLNELAAAFKGVCKALKKDNYDYCPALPTLGNQISSVAATLGYDIPTTGDLGQTGCNLQRLIDYVLDSNVISYDELRLFIDKELIELPPSPLVDYITGEQKIKP